MEVSFEYDPEVDGLFIWFTDNIENVKSTFDHEVWPQELNGEIGLLLKENGKLLGLEILSASKYFDAQYLETK